MWIDEVNTKIRNSGMKNNCFRYLKSVSWSSLSKPDELKWKLDSINLNIKIFSGKYFYTYFAYVCTCVCCFAYLDLEERLELRIIIECMKIESIIQHHWPSSASFWSEYHIHMQKSFHLFYCNRERMWTGRSESNYAFVWEFSLWKYYSPVQFIQLIGNQI